MYMWDETWEPFEVETVETKLYDSCNHNKSFHFDEICMTDIYLLKMVVTKFYEIL